MNYPFGQRRIWIKKGAPTEADAKACLDQTVVMRFAAARVQPRYTPASLRPFRPALGKWAKDVLPPDEIRG